jgi:hypothetical protein
VSRTALRTTLIWHDEVMGDLVLDKPRPVTIGQHRRTTFVVPEIGLPPKFAIVRPGNRGYLLTLGERMRGTICIDGEKQDVAEIVQREGTAGFCATPIGSRDWGVIELDESGHYKLFFQFVAVDDPPQFFTKQVVIAGIAGYLLSNAALIALWYLNGVELTEAAIRGALLATVAVVVGGIGWTLIRQDGESQASLAFSVVLHAAFLFMTYQLYDGENPFVWPGPRALAGNYLVARLDREDPPEPKPVPSTGNTQQAEQPAAPTKDPPKRTATKGTEGRAGGKGETERARDPNAKDVPPEVPRVGVFEGNNQRVINDVVDRNLVTNLGKYLGIQDDTQARGSVGFGSGAGNGVGAGNGTGTRTGSRGNGTGGGGNIAGDFTTGPGRIDTGGVRPGSGNCKGPGCGSGPKAVQVALAEPTGDFGGLTAEEIDRVVKASRGLFRICYQKELNRTPGIGGKLVIHFRIGGDGRVQSANTATASGTTLHNDAVEQCVKRNINTMLHFPAKGGIANVNYPFVFTQGG